jgi:virginiamycin B lyase
MRRLILLTISLILVGLTWPAALVQAASSLCVEEIEIPDAPSPGLMVRIDLAIDSQGKVWFTQLELNQIGWYDPSLDEFALFDVPIPESGPHSITVDSQDIVWFTETEGHQIGRFDPVSETFVEQLTPTPFSKPYGIAVDGADNIWFTEMNAVAIGIRLAVNGKIIEVPLDPATDEVENITVDTVNSIMWVTDLPNGKLIRLNPFAPRLTRFQIPWFPAGPHSVAVASNGFVWFSDLKGNSIGRLNPTTGQFLRFPIRTANSVPHGIIVNSRGLVWFAELSGNKIGLLIPKFNNIIVELDVPTTGGNPYFLAEAPDKEIWFTEAGAPFIGWLPCTTK